MNQSTNRKGRRVSNPEGFTILELLIATLILAVGLLGVAALQTVAIKGNMDGKNYTVASSLIADKLDELRNGEFADIADDTDYITFDDKVPQVQANSPGEGFFMTRNVQVSAGPAAGTLRVAVEVSWQSREGAARRTEYETIIAN